MQTVQSLTVWEHVGYDPMLHNSYCAPDAHCGKKRDKTGIIPDLKMTHF